MRGPISFASSRWPWEISAPPWPSRAEGAPKSPCSPGHHAPSSRRNRPNAFASSRRNRPNAAPLSRPARAEIAPRTWRPHAQLAPRSPERPARSTPSSPATPQTPTRAPGLLAPPTPSWTCTPLPHPLPRSFRRLRIVFVPSPFPLRPSLQNLKARPVGKINRASTRNPPFSVRGGASWRARSLSHMLSGGLRLHGANEIQEVKYEMPSSVARFRDSQSRRLVQR